MKSHKNTIGSMGFVIPIILFFIVILLMGAYGTTILQKSNEGYTFDNNTTMGKTAETNNQLQSTIMGLWPYLAILCGLIVFLAIGAWIMNSGSQYGR